jgi:integrase
VPNWARGILFQKRSWRHIAKCHRPHYEDYELRAILQSPLWAGCRSVNQRSKMGAMVIKDALYWSLPVAALAGLRLEEMARLRLEHVVEVDGIWCFVVRNDEVLTHERSRLVPIHSMLLKLGLLERVESFRGAGHDRLFPELLLDPCHNRYGTTLTRRLARYLKAIGHGVPGRGYSGARLNFGDNLMESGISDEILSALLGYARRVGPFERFMKKQRLWELKEAIETVDHDLPLVERDGQWHLARTR